MCDNKISANAFALADDSIPYIFIKIKVFFQCLHFFYNLLLCLTFLRLPLTDIFAPTTGLNNIRAT